MKSQTIFTTVDPLEIPENIPLRWEMFRGFGFSELCKAAAIVLPACLGAWLYTRLSDSPMRILTAIVIVLASAIIAVGLFVKQNNNLSMYDYVKYAVQFSKSQKQYDNIRQEEFVYEQSAEA